MMGKPVEQSGSVAKNIVASKKDNNDKPLKPIIMEKVTVDTFGEDIKEPVIIK